MGTTKNETAGARAPEAEGTMKAIVHEEYGLPTEVLALREVAVPAVGEDDVLVRVAAASVNPYDWHTVTGTPVIARLSGGVRRPKAQTPGADVAGTVEAVGSNVTEFAPGDEVFGMIAGSYAELATAKERHLAPKPANVTFEEAAAVPLAGYTAIQALRDKGELRAGQSVLINGASGGVGTLAIQMAKSMGAEVTAVCSTRNVDMVRSIGADHVIDYTKEDFTRCGRRFDLVLDSAANRSMMAIKRVLAPTGKYVAFGAPKSSLGALGFLARVNIASLLGKPKMTVLLARGVKDDLVEMARMLETGTLKPVLDRNYTLADIPEALRYQGEGHAQGKTTITVIEGA